MYRRDWGTARLRQPEPVTFPEEAPTDDVEPRISGAGVTDELLGLTRPDETAGRSLIERLFADAPAMGCSVAVGTALLAGRLGAPLRSRRDPTLLLRAFPESRLSLNRDDTERRRKRGDVASARVELRIVAIEPAVGAQGWARPATRFWPGITDLRLTEAH